MTRAIKRLVSRLVPAPREAGCRVLLYHAVGEPDAADRLSLRVAPESFHAQMALLKADGYQVAPLRALLDGAGGRARPRVAITFDDGYRNQLQAAEILEAFAFPATFFVVTGFLERHPSGGSYWDRWDHLRWGDVKGLAGRGFEIGCHSASHQRLTGCSPERLEAEIRDAKACLEDRLGGPVTSFSYPHGASNRLVRQAVQDAGYQLACTSVYGANRGPVAPFELERTEVQGSDRVADFRRKLHGRYDWTGRWQRWRCARIADA